MAREIKELKALDNVEFFSQMHFLFRKDEEAQKKMLSILEKDAIKAREEVERELETSYILLLGEEHPSYWKHFGRMLNKNLEISCRNLLDYGNYLTRTFSSFDIKQPIISLERKNPENLENIDYSIQTTPEFLYSIYFGYKFSENNLEIIHKIKYLLEKNKNKKSADFFTAHDREKADKFIRENQIFTNWKSKHDVEKAKNYLWFLENQIGNPF